MLLFSGITLDGDYQHHHAHRPPQRGHGLPRNLFAGLQASLDLQHLRGARCSDTRPLLPCWRPEIRGTVGWEKSLRSTYSITGAHLYGGQGRVSHPRGSTLPASHILHVAACMTCSNWGSPD
ncbi:hypothetical protein GGI43DRAFT_116271 [Trichoderma evansii]